MSTCVTVRQGYDRWAQIYDRTPNPVLALEERHLPRLLPDLVGKNVLDLACGTGRWIPRLLARGARHVIGIDLSVAMLRVAAEKAEIRERLVLADCGQLPFTCELFDFALCSFALNHIRTLETVTQELGRTLKERSTVLISEMHPDAYAEGWRPGFRDSHSAAQIESVSHSAEQVVSRFREIGFVCSNHYDLTFGEPELPIFQEAGRSAMFGAACRFPAVKLYEFRRGDAAMWC
jgi:malonyl-CoA O-methyltransferase